MPSMLNTNAQCDGDCKEIKPVNLKRNQPCIFIGRTEAEAETLIVWPPDMKKWLIWKDPDAGKDWRWEKGMTEDELVGWHHRLDERELEWTLGVGDGQGRLPCRSPWGRKELDMTEQLNWTEDSFLFIFMAFHFEGKWLSLPCPTCSIFYSQTSLNLRGFVFVMTWVIYNQQNEVFVNIK